MTRYLFIWYDALNGEGGQNLAEYALLLALVAVALVLVVGAMANGIGNVFNAARNVLATNQLGP